MHCVQSHKPNLAVMAIIVRLVDCLVGKDWVTGLFGTLLCYWLDHVLLCKCNFSLYFQSVFAFLPTKRSLHSRPVHLETWRSVFLLCFSRVIATQRIPWVLRTHSFWTAGGNFFACTLPRLAFVKTANSTIALKMFWKKIVLWEAILWGKSDVIAVGERATVCKEAKWADHDRYSFSSSFSFSNSSSALLSHCYSHFMFSVTKSDFGLLALHPPRT